MKTQRTGAATILAMALGVGSPSPKREKLTGRPRRVAGLQLLIGS